MHPDSLIEKKTTVLLADDPPVRMDCLAQKFTASGIRTITVQADGRTLLKCIFRYTPEIVLYDFPGGDRYGLSLLHAISDLSGGQVKTITCTECADIAAATAFMASGGCGYLLKSCPAEEILLAIRRVQMGEKYCCSALGLKMLIDHSEEHPSLPSELIRNLPDYLRRILPEIPESNTTKELTRKCHLSDGTIKNYRQKIMDALGIYDWNELKRRLKATILEQYFALPVGIISVYHVVDKNYTTW